MCNFTYESHGTNTYLVYEIKPEDVVDSLSLGMLTNNKISGLASTIFTQMDSVKYIKYNISSKVSAKQFFSGVVNKKRLLGVFSGIAKGILSSEEYMIDEKSLILDLEHIFVDVTTCESVLICLPISNMEGERTDSATFFKNIMFTTQFDQTENCDHVAKIMNFLNSMPIFSITEFKKLLDQLEDEAKNVTVNVVKPAQNIAPAQNVAPVQPPRQPQTSVAPAPTAAPQAQPQVRQPQPQQPQRRPQQPQQQQFNVPGGQRVPAKSAPKANNASQNQPKMTMFKLLTHYSKENAAIYKEQKAAAKGKKAVKAPKAAATSKGKAAKPQKASQRPPQKSKTPAKQAPQAQFAIPGQSAQPIAQNAAPQARPANAPTPQQRPQPAPQQRPQPAPQQRPPQAMQQSAPQARPQPMPQPVVQPVPQPAPQVHIPTAAPVNFGETTILGGGGIGETTVLNAGMQQNNAPIPHLIRQKNNEKIMLNKPVYRIGKERSYVDYFVGDNPAISRSHANIIINEGRYFVEDTNSTNHTFVDGAMIQSSVQVEIQHGTKIRLANEEFEFRLY